MTSSNIPPNFLLFRAPSTGEGKFVLFIYLLGLGNIMEGVSFAFLLAILSGRSFLLDFTTPYNISENFFLPPGFDWSYHKHLNTKNIQEFPTIPKETQDLAEITDEPIVSFSRLSAEDLFETPAIQKTIPFTLRNWKINILRFLFSNPNKDIKKRIEGMKQNIANKGFHRIIGIQIRNGIEGSSGKYEQHIACAKYWSEWRKSTGKTAFFVASDLITVRDAVAQKIGVDSVFFFNTTPAGPNEAHNRNMNEANQRGVVLDWYMLGECDSIILTAASSFGITAADRGAKDSYPSRFHIGGKTTCTDPTSDYFLEKIYHSPMETFYDTGKMKWLQYIH